MIKKIKKINPKDWFVSLFFTLSVYWQTSQLCW